MRAIPVALLLLCLTACPNRKTPPPPEGPQRCEVDLDGLELFSKIGNGAAARVVDDASALIGGQSAEGRTGDVLLENDRLRVIISQPGRQIGAVPYGGVIIDADRVRGAGIPGQDRFGKLGLVRNLRRLPPRPPPPTAQAPPQFQLAM
ncbi:MAG: hypothetical protein ACT4TC_20675 [Myxococcaceae bacterium]